MYKSPGSSCFKYFIEQSFQHPQLKSKISPIMCTILRNIIIPKITCCPCSLFLSSHQSSTLTTLFVLKSTVLGKTMGCSMLLSLPKLLLFLLRIQHIFNLPKILLSPHRSQLIFNVQSQTCPPCLKTVHPMKNLRNWAENLPSMVEDGHFNGKSEKFDSKVWRRSYGLLLTATHSRMEDSPPPLLSHEPGGGASFSPTVQGWESQAPLGHMKLQLGVWDCS